MGRGWRSRVRGTSRLDALLFGETQSRIVITCQPLDAVKVVERAKFMGVPAARIGTVGGDKLVDPNDKRCLFCAARQLQIVVEYYCSRDELARIRRVTHNPLARKLADCFGDN